MGFKAPGGSLVLISLVDYTLLGLGQVTIQEMKGSVNMCAKELF